MNGTLAGVLAIFIWSFLPVLIVFTGQVPALLMAAMAFLIGFITLTAYQFFMKENIISHWKQPLSDYIFVTCGIGVYTVLLYFSFKLVAPFEANSLNFLWPILLVLFSAFLYEDKIRIGALLGSFLGFVGVFLIFFPQDGHGFFNNLEWGHILAISAAVLWSIYSVLAKKRSYTQGIMAPVFCFSALICFALHFFFEQTVWPDGLGWVALIALGVGRISYSFWDYSMKEGDTVLLASLAYFVPLLSTVSLILIGAQPNHYLIGLGAFFIIGGCFIVNAAQIIKPFKKGRRIL